MRLSIYARTMLLIGVSLSVVTIGMTYLTIRTRDDALTHALRSRLETLTEQSAATVSDALWTLNRNGAQAILQGIARDPDFFSATILDDNGNAFVFIGGSVEPDVQTEQRVGAVEVDEGGSRRTIGWIYVEFTLARLRQVRNEAAWDAFALGMLQLAAVLAATALALRAVSRPLAALSAHMVKIAGDQLDPGVPHLGRTDGIGDLARAVESFRNVSQERIRAEQALVQANESLERRVAERTRELSESDARLRDAIESISEGFVIFDTEDRLVVFNSRYAELYPRSVNAKAIGERFEDVIRRGVELGEYPQAQGNEEGWIRERLARHRNPGGAVEQEISGGRWLQITDRRMQNGGIAGLRMDITARKSAEQALRDSESMFRNFLTSSPDAMIVVDQSRRIVLVSERAEMLFGYDRGEMIGKPFANLLPAPFQRRYSMFLTCLATQTGKRRSRGARTLRATRKDGEELMVEVSLSLNPAPGGPLTVAALRDVTLRKQAEETLRHAQKMEALGTLAGGIAHDLNNTLVPILGLSELAQLYIPEGNEANAHLRDVAKSAIRAKDLVDQILAFSRSETPDRHEIDLLSVATSAIKIARAAIPPRIAVTLDAAPGQYILIGNETQLHQVIMNLCINAAQAIGDRPGNIKLGLEVADLDTGRERDPTIACTHAIKLLVADDGSGMDEATRQRIFEPFFTTKAVGEGTGLGLSIVHAIVTRYGGAITVKSRPGKGARFELLFPAANAAPVAAVRPVEMSEAQSAQKGIS